MDCLIIGSGPAGVAAAIACKRAGANLAVVSRPQLPQLSAPLRTAETISASLDGPIAQLGLEDCFAAARLCPIVDLQRNGQRIAASSSPLGWHIDRDLLERALSARLSELEVPVHVGEVTQLSPARGYFVVEIHGSQPIYARRIIDASAASGGPLQRFYQRPRLLSPLLLSVSGVVNESDFPAPRDVTSFSARRWGWIWCTAAYNGQRSWTALQAAGWHHPAEVAKLEKVSLPQSVIAEAAYWRLNVQASPRVIPIGDASGSLDPSAGVGLYNALSTGLAVANTISMRRSDDGRADASSAAFSESRSRLILTQAKRLSKLYAEQGTSIRFVVPDDA